MDRRQLLQGTAALGAAAALPRGQETAGAEERPPRPNVLLIFPDQLRAASVGCYGDPRVATPHLDALASQGLRFTRALVAGPVCSHYRVQLATGKYTHLTQPKLEPDDPTVFKSFHASGYHVGYIGKWHMTPRVLKTGPRDFVPAAVRGGIDWSAMYEVRHSYKRGKYYLNDDERPRSAAPWEPDHQAELAGDYLRARARDDKPFFLTVSMGPPHQPYEPPDEYDHYAPEEVPLRPNVPAEHAAEARERIALYYGLVEAVDAAIGRILLHLERAGLAENTLVVITSDHGDMLKSQGLDYKRKPWHEAIHVPLILRRPDGSGKYRGAGRSDTRMFRSIDLFPTLAAHCGVELPAGVQGVDVLAGDGPAYTYVELIQPHKTPHDSPWRAVVTRDGWKLAASQAVPDWLLYDHNEDPFEQRNLIAAAEHAPRRKELQAYLRELAEETGDDFFG